MQWCLVTRQRLLRFLRKCIFFDSNVKFKTRETEKRQYDTNVKITLLMQWHSTVRTNPKWIEWVSWTPKIPTGVYWRCVISVGFDFLPFLSVESPLLLRPACRLRPFSIYILFSAVNATVVVVVSVIVTTLCLVGKQLSDVFPLTRTRLEWMGWTWVSMGIRSTLYILVFAMSVLLEMNISGLHKVHTENDMTDATTNQRQPPTNVWFALIYIISQHNRPRK